MSPIRSLAGSLILQVNGVERVTISIIDLSVGGHCSLHIVHEDGAQNDY